MTDLGAIGISGGIIRPGKARGLVDASKALAAKLGIEILLMDADMIFGRVHIESAVEHADRAFERGINVAETRMLEVMLYSSGERQLSTAIEKMGVKPATGRLAVVVNNHSMLTDVLAALNIERDDGVLDGEVARLAAYGISREAIDSVGDKNARELVLEKIARVDMIK